MGTQGHILCEGTALAQVKLSNQIDLHRHSPRLPPGRERTLGAALVHPLHSHKMIDERGQLWMELWTPEQRHLIATPLGEDHGNPPQTALEPQRTYCEIQGLQSSNARVGYCYECLCCVFSRFTVLSALELLKKVF